MADKKYYIGLDIGTNSIGWAVTDTEYNIPKFRGNAMWGIRLLDESKTAEERRLFRCSRRRTERNKFRLQCLEMLFDKEISKKDITFFQRLKESNLYLEDKKTECRYTVFNDPDYTDKDFHKKYPTVYHLRKELITSDKPHDVRLVYLALAHIVKHRGHFLFDSDFSDIKGMSFSDIWSNFTTYCCENYDLELECSEPLEIEKVLKNNRLNLTKKKQLLLEILKLKKSDKQKTALITLLTGGTAKTAELYDDEEYKDSEYKSICISSGFDDKEAEYAAFFGDRIDLLKETKAVYDWVKLSVILNNEDYISFAKVKIYEKHKKDLKLLKAFVKKYCPEKYAEIFKINDKEKANYAAYSAHCKSSPENTNCTIESFCEYIKKALPQVCPDEKYADMYREIETASFMPKAVSKDNSVLPMQIHREELKKILENAEKYLPFLKEEDENHKTAAAKIMDIFSFRVPYYVGPLNRHSDKAWVVRKDEKIYPWNFSEVVDTEKSAERFIENLTGKCTYLRREDVIPKNSLLYTSYMVLNELNNVRINGEKLPVEIKHKVYEELFLAKKKVTQKALKSYLKTLSFPEIDEAVISGIDGDFKSSLTPWIDLKEISLTQDEKEEVIKAITIFGDDRRLLKKRLAKKYGEKLSEEEIKKIAKLKYKDWARFSKKLLTEIKSVVDDSVEEINIIRALWNTQYNFMELLSDRYDFDENINKENTTAETKTLKEEIDDLYVSPKVKRPIYQAMQIVEELRKIKGCKPDKIFIEMARGEEEKVRTKSRKEKLLELYKASKEQSSALYKILETKTDNELRRDALYLYFTQMGKCMYTGEAIDLENLYNRNMYDIDHIYPQSKIKDDSLNNRVLVNQKANKDKSDIYPVKPEIQKKMSAFWKMLLEKELISQKKYERLTRVTPLGDEELNAFISRQLVETRQSTKAIAQLLNNTLNKEEYTTEIVYVKAGNVSDFRQKYDFLKCREVNDLHHAKDAYLNIVVGNVYNTLFNHNKLAYIKGLQSNKYSVNRMFDHSVNGAWVTEGNKSISTVRNTMSKNNIRFTRYASTQKGGLFDINLMKKGHGQVSIKKNSPCADISKYGGYNRPASTYFAIAGYVNKKGKSELNIIPVDLYNEKEYCENREKYIASYIKKNIFDELDPATVKIIIPSLKYNSMISVNGFRMHISSKSGGGRQYVCKPAVQLVVGYEMEKYIKTISNYMEKCKEDKSLREDTVLFDFMKLSKEKNEELYRLLTDKLTKTVYKEKRAEIGKKLLEKTADFKEISPYEQCYVLTQLLAIIHCDVRTGDLKAIGESGQSGALYIGYKIEKSKTLKSFKLINQSITGLYETETELLS